MGVRGGGGGGGTFRPVAERTFAAVQNLHFDFWLRNATEHCSAVTASVEETTAMPVPFEFQDAFYFEKRCCEIWNMAPPRNSFVSPLPRFMTGLSLQYSHISQMFYYNGVGGEGAGGGGGNDTEKYSRMQ